MEGYLLRLMQSNKNNQIRIDYSLTHKDIQPMFTGWQTVKEK